MREVIIIQFIVLRRFCHNSLKIIIRISIKKVFGVYRWALGFFYYLRTLVKSCRNMTESGAVRPGLIDQPYSASFDSCTGNYLKFHTE